MRALFLCGLLMGSLPAFSQTFDRVDWAQSSVNSDEAKVVLVNPKFVAIDNVRLTEVAQIYFTGEGMMGFVAFDCSVKDSSFDLQWGELIEGVVQQPHVALKPSVPFGLTSNSRSLLAADDTWSQVCGHTMAADFPTNVLWDEALLHVRLNNKHWRKRFDVPAIAFKSLERQYRKLPFEQRQTKLQQLMDKRLEREELRGSFKIGGGGRP